MRYLLKELGICLTIALVLVILIGSVVYAATWEFKFPIEVTDTSLTSRSYVSVMLGFNGQTLIDNGKIESDGLDTNMQIGATDIKYMMSTGNVTAIIPLLGSGATQELDFYAGYSPEQTTFSIVTGEGGYITISDNETIELGNNYEVVHSGYIDMSTAGNITYKEEAYNTYTDGSGNITNHSTLNINQDNRTANEELWGAGGTRYGQRIDNFPISEILSISFSLSKHGLPTGTANVTARTVDGDTLLGIIGTIDVATLNGVSTWHEFDTSPITNNSARDLRFLIEYDGGDAFNYLEAGRASSDYGIGEYTYYFVGAWSDDSSQESTIRIKYSATLLSIADISSGDYDITVESDETFMGLGIDATTADFPISDSLVFNAPLYHHDMTGNFTTKDVNGYTCNVSGATWTSSGYSFDGTNDYIITDVDIAPTAFTLVCWINTAFTASVDDTRGIIEKRSALGEWRLYTIADGKRIRYDGWDAGGVGIGVITSSILDEDTWYHIALTYNGTSKERIMYINSSPDISSSAGNAIRDTGSIIRIGTDALAADRYFDGYIGEVQIYDDVLTPSEVTTLYNDTAWKYNGSSEYFHYQYTGGASVADNSNNWILGSSATPYIDYYKHTVNGTLQAWYQPNTMLSGTTLPDRQNDFDGTITWGSNSNLTIAFGAMETSGSYTASSDSSYFELDLASMPDTWFAGGEDLADLPFYDWFNDISSETGVPVQTMYFWVILGISFGAFIGLVVFTRSAFIGVLAMVVVLAIGSSMTIVPLWIVFVVLLVDIGIMYLYRQVSY